MSHIQINHVFLLFWSIFVEIQRKLLFLVKKVTFSEKRTEKLTKFVFLNMFENRQTLRKIWICLNNCFWSNLWNGGCINKKCFSPQSKPHTAKQFFLLFWSFFAGNSQRTSLFRPKSDYLRKENWNTHSLFFLTCLKMGKSWGEFGFV